MTSSNSSALQNNSVWFSVSIGLMGLIVGYGIAVMGTGTRGGGVPNIPVVPSAPTDDQQPQALEPVQPIDAEEDHLLGPASAKITVIEYMDYECPFCKRHQETMLALRDKYEGQVSFAMRHFPLDFHQNAMKESEAAECVAELGGNTAFWKFSDLMIEKTTSGGTGLALDQLPELAAQAGVNKSKFSSCLDSGRHQQKILAQQAAGQAAGVNGTPGNIIYNNVTKESRVIPGAVALSTMTAAIDAMLGK